MAARYNMKGVMYALGLLVVVNAWRLGDKFTFLNDDERKAFVKKYDRDPKARKAGKVYEGLPVR